MNTQKPNFQHLLNQAVKEPGKLLEAYSNFHGYSFGNRFLALLQCVERDIKPGPIATYKKWNELGRQVKKGSKAIGLFMPVTIKTEKENDEGETESFSFSRFMFKNKWFVLSQTEGDDLAPVLSPAFDQSKALKELNIELIPFDHLNGNVQGFAIDRRVAINPLAQLPLKTLFHEIAHVLLGHTELTQHDEQIPKSLKEVEAESVAMLCLASLNLPGVEYCRGYIQHWIDSDSIPEKSCQKIFKTVDQILKAGEI